MKQEFCVRGHELTEENRYENDGRCRTCNRERTKSYYENAEKLAARLAKQACPAGHPLSPDALDYRGRCMECKREEARLRRLRKAELRRNGDWMPARATLAEKLPADPIRDWLNGYVVRDALLHDDGPLRRLSLQANIPSRRLWGIRNGEFQNVTLDIVDRILVAAGEPPQTLHDLYPLGARP